jgi:hypothetical protein
MATNPSSLHHARLDGAHDGSGGVLDRSRRGAAFRKRPQHDRLTLTAAGRIMSLRLPGAGHDPAFQLG